MNQHSIVGIGLALILAAGSLTACSEAASTPQNPGTTGGTGTGATSAGGTPGGSSSGGSSGSVTSGGGTSAGGTAGGISNGGSGGLVGGGASAGTAGDDAGIGGMGTGGVGGSGGGNTGPVTVQLGQTRQKIDGFGINNTWAQAMTDADADALFSTTNGLGFSILRVGLGPDGNPMSSNIPADITKARARNVTYIIGSCWSPPANCKTNNNINDGGHLLTSCYESWSTTIANFANTHDLYAMSIGNEPDFASCGRSEPCNGNYPTTLYTANEYVAFLKVAGPKLRAAGVKVIAPEASEWIHNWSNTSATGSEPSNLPSSDPLDCGFPPTNPACNNGGGYDYGHALYRDQTAWGLLDIMGVHQYDTQVAEPWPADVPTAADGVPPKPVWQTEMSGVKWWPEQGPSAHIDNGVAVAEWVHDALTRGMASAWLWWWWRAFDTDDNEGLYIKNGSGWTDTKRHYTLMNYSRFIRPNYMRVDVNGAVPADVLLSAYKAGTGNTVVIVAINKGTASATLPITIAGGTAPATLTPWVTSASDNFASKTPVAVTDGTFMATLAGKTVTTFVGQ
jgi:glucuronoarabinoxylan endo-1,4-beta-xylanase